MGKLRSSRKSNGSGRAGFLEEEGREEDKEEVYIDDIILLSSDDTAHSKFLDKFQSIV